MSGSFVAPPLDDDEETNGSGSAKGRLRSASGVSSIAEEEDEDRLDARNAASRLATSTF